LALIWAGTKANVSMEKHLTEGLVNSECSSFTVYGETYKGATSARNASSINKHYQVIDLPALLYDRNYINVYYGLYRFSRVLLDYI